MTKLDATDNICIPSVKLLGDFWTLRIVDVLSDGPRRFCEIQRTTDDVNPVTLTNRLKKLQGANIISRDEHSRGEVTYQLTEVGQKVLPVLDAINNFSKAAKATT
jgi:DNA-binding HxlR family transcriptional regulator